MVIDRKGGDVTTRARQEQGRELAIRVQDELGTDGWEVLYRLGDRMSRVHPPGSWPAGTWQQELLGYAPRDRHDAEEKAPVRFDIAAGGTPGTLMHRQGDPDMTADTQTAQNGAGRSRLMGSTNDLADDTPRSRMDHVLQWVPRILSSKPHVIALMALGVYLIVLPLLGVMVSAKAELIGGNYTNVTSDIAASIAAGGTLHLVNQGRKRRTMDAERLRLARETHELLHQVYGDAARQLGHITGTGGPAAGRPPASGEQDRPDPGSGT